jgi:hypothetical protein
LKGRLQATGYRLEGHGHETDVAPASIAEGPGNLRPET